MELVALKCPKCGGELEVHEGQKKTFCKYCGSQILLDDGNRIINVIDEARLKEIKLNKEVSDFDQKLRDEETSGRYKNASQKQGWIIACIVLHVIFTLVFSGAVMYQSVFAIIASICLWVALPVIMALIKPRNAGGMGRIKTAVLFYITFTAIFFGVGKLYLRFIK